MRIVHGWTLCALAGLAAQGCVPSATTNKTTSATSNYIAPPQPMAITQPAPNGIQQAGHQVNSSVPTATDTAWPNSPAPKPVPNVPIDEPRQINVIWQNYVAVTQDSQNNGQPLRGVAGRMYFMGADGGHTFQALGRITVTLREIKPDGQPSDKSEVWKIDGHTLQNFLRKDDLLGWGYTLFLPSSTIRPDVKEVELQIKFEPIQGAPIYSQPSKISFRQDPGAAPIISSRIDGAK